MHQPIELRRYMASPLYKVTVQQIELDNIENLCQLFYLRGRRVVRVLPTKIGAHAIITSQNRN